MGRIARYLNQLINGDVFDTPEILEAYSTDRSVLKIKPKLVALPESTEDIRKLMRFSSQLASKGISIPVTVRGSGLDEMGADLGSGMIISTERLNRLLESDKRERLVRVQAGITLRELNLALSINGLTIPIVGHDNETIGGIISNCPADDWSGKYGGIYRFVERLEAVLPNGDLLQTSRISKRAVMRRMKDKTNESRIYGRILQLIKKNEPLLKVLRANKQDLSGYKNIVRVADKTSMDLLPLFFGSEGTLGVITEVILRAVPIQKETKRVAITFRDFSEADKLLDLAKSLKPLELNFYDLRTVKIAEKNGKKPNEITKKMDTGFVVLAKFDGKSNAKVRKIEKYGKKMTRSVNVIIENNKTISALNDLESSLVSFTNLTKIDGATPLMVGFSVPGGSIPGLVNDLKVLETSLKLDLALYGSYSASNYNLSPKLNVKSDDFRKQATNFLRTSAYVIKRQGGAIVRGTPEGRVKAIAADSTMTDAEKALYITIKNIFDRQGILNPNVKVGVDDRFTIRHFRSL